MREKLSRYWSTIQSGLFPWLKEETSATTAKHFEVIAVLEVSRVEEFILGDTGREVGRPKADRRAIARAFVAKAVLNIPTTRQLLDRLEVDAPLRRICGWERRSEIPSESVFSRAFAEFAASELPSRVHESLIVETYQEQLIGHISRDSTEIEAREKPVPKPEQPGEQPQRKRGRPKRGEPPQPQEPSRLSRQQAQTLEQMLDDLPKTCDTGVKRNSKGFQTSWNGYKLHLDIADGQVPISALLTSASVHDSQVAIPLAMLSNQRVTNLYDLMDAAYDAPQIREHSLELGHRPIIDINPRRNAELKQELLDEAKAQRTINFKLPEKVRFRERSTAERAIGCLKDNAGGRFVRVRGPAKVLCHLMFGVLAISAEQIIKQIL